MTRDEFRTSLEGVVGQDSTRQGRPSPAPVLHYLAFGKTRREMDREDWLTWVLRPHRDAPLSGTSLTAEAFAADLTKAEVIALLPEGDLVALLRRRLDDALDALTRLEIELQCGAVDHESTLDFPEELQRPLCALAMSEAFLRYLDSYRFFGVRFLMGRDWTVRDAWREARNRSIRPEARKRSTSQPDQFNRPVLPLETPPSLGLDVGDRDEVVSVIRDLCKPLAEDEQQAMFFLDGFYQKLSSKTGSAESQAGEIAAKIEDDGSAAEQDVMPNVRDLELWMRGMLPELPAQSDLPVIARGLAVWATERAQKYDRLSEERGGLDGTMDAAAVPWRKTRCDTPRATRVALLDLYWLAGVLRAVVTPFGSVTYEPSSWLSLLRFRETLDLPLDAPTVPEWPLERVEEVLRSAFSSACELVQNAAAVTEARNRQDAEREAPLPPLPGVKDWRDVFDAELYEVDLQRKLRGFQPFHKQDDSTAKHPGWSRRLFEKGQPRDLVGIAFSGGGIRSATFNLGVLQGLQELDLLRQVDFLSTVSGGGFIGSWLLGNVKRTRYWLTRQTPWDSSIALLRTYSNYLAPRTGFFSLDTWSLGTLWLRNTLLIQMSILVFMLLLLTAPYLMRVVAVAAVGQLGKSNFHDLASGGRWIVRGTYVMAGLVMVAIILSLLWPDAGFADWRARVGRGEPWYKRVLGVRNLLGAVARGLRKVVRHFPVRFVKWVKSPWPLRLWQSMISPGCIRWFTAVPAWTGAVMVSARLYGISIESRAYPTFQDPSRMVAPAAPPAPADTILGQMYLNGPTDGLIHGISLHSQVYATIEEWARAVAPHPAAAVQSTQQVEMPTSFANILFHGAALWPAALIAGAIAFALLLLVSLWIGKRQLEGTASARWVWLGRAAVPIVIGAALCTGVLHLCFSAVLFVYLRLHLAFPGAPAGVHNLAFLAGPSLVLLSYSAALLMLIGLSGKYCTESQREWWTRFGSYMVSVALMGLLLCGVAFGSPWIIHWLLGGMRSKFAIPTVLVGWVGTTVSGLLAGKSKKTSGEPATRSVSLELLAQVGGLLFLVGAAIGAAELLYQFFHVFLDDNTHPHVSESIAAIPWGILAGTFVVLFALSCLFSWFFEINIFGLNQLYRNRLVRCYLGATRWMPGMRSPEPFTRFDFNDDLELSSFRTDQPAPFRGPFPIINCTLNMSGSRDLALHTRHSASFSMTPLFCGADRAKVRYRETPNYARGVRLGQAVAISGAAASPNMGYNTSPLVAFLLTMFNVRLGWWAPNPSGKSASKTRLGFSLYYLLRELIGLADESQPYLNLSDGGHFENLGIYELVRRNCTVIIAGDAECDDDMAFGGLANAIRLCQTDFGAIIDIDVSSIRRRPEGYSHAHASVGTIKYSNGSIGHIIYLKSSVTGDEDPTIAQYRDAHPTFPHESTADQFFSEDQFESYRRLGQHVVRNSFRGALPGDHLVRVTQKMADMAAPVLVSTDAFLRHSRLLNKVWDRLRQQAQSVPAGAPTFLSELLGDRSQRGVRVGVSEEVTTIGLEMLQLMEGIFIDLRLDDSWDHPDNRGWAMLFLNWARSPSFRQIWNKTHRTFGIRFEYFCANRLGLKRDHPVVRVTPVAAR